ncbi:MAG: SUMF1/EgtB/PvdO family nonheme iron enzyme [Planctomycetes bacterium]|nr:SUMF1/EgtB/PvdO family nonheme iron enzyme [Planctomycetota bacterium]
MARSAGCWGAGSGSFETTDDGAAGAARGGSFHNDRNRLRVSYRNDWRQPANRNDNLGFRCVAAPPRRPSPSGMRRSVVHRRARRAGSRPLRGELIARPARPFW